MEDEMTKLKLANEEDDQAHDHEESDEVEEDFKLCLVRKVLTNSTAHFLSLRNMLAEVWHPIEGVTITEMEDKRILSRFYNELDLKNVVDGMFRFFNRHLIIFHKLDNGEGKALTIRLHVGRNDKAIRELHRRIYGLRCNNCIKRN
ncbi:hypothetical protein J1N35_024964 [Gossypium stocksii]|uniref:DUF4283 domain-containing protein n=1 Tax=Gossypium stocksii TaxID=47602 RepID=A0A9D3V6K8_9ROSI|nr:hypothetical protein J1N35_024964 [Gossypium stocksii]